MSRKSLHSTNSDGSSSPLGYWDSKRSPKYSSSLSDNLNVDRRLSSLVPFSFPGLPSGTNVTPNLRDRSNLGQNTTASLNIPKLTHHDSIISTFFDERETCEPLVPLEIPVIVHTKAYVANVHHAFLNWTRYHSLSHGIGSMSTTQVDRDVQDCIDTVPTHFFDPKFKVFHPKFFDPLADSDNMFLHETLSSYLDLVEVGILKQVSQRSNAFFAALCTVQDLYVRIGYICLVISKLRDQIRRLHTASIQTTFSSIRDSLRLDNAKRLSSFLDRITTVQNSLQSITMLLESRDYNYALDLIEFTDDILKYQLGGIKCVVGFQEMLDCSKLELVNLVLEDFRLISAIPPTDGDIAEYESQLVQMISCVGRLGYLHRILDCYFEAITRHISATVSQILEGVFHQEFLEVSLTDIERNKDLVELFESITHPTFLNFVCILTRQIRCILASTNSRIDVFMLFTSKSSTEQCISGDNDSLSIEKPFVTKSWFPTSKELDEFKLQFTDSMKKTCEVSLELVSYFIRVHQPTFYSNVYELKSVLDLYSKLVSFVESPELLNTTLTQSRSVILNQAKAYLSTLHQRSVDALAVDLENEQWVNVSVSTRYQRLLDRGLVSVVALSEHDTTTTSAMDMFNALNDISWDTDDFSTPGDTIVLNDTRFYVVRSVLSLIDSISEYMECGVLVEVVVEDTLRKLVQLLGVFNSRTCQLVLGAGAMQTAGLKNINSKHLTLASQSLGVVIELVSLLRAKFAVSLTERHHRFLKEFDRIQNDLLDHRNEIFAKLVKIMRDLIDGACGRLVRECRTNIDLNRPVSAAPGKDGVSHLIRSLMKQCKQLHRVVTTYLSPRDRDYMFTEIAANFTSTTALHFGGFRDKFGDKDQYLETQVLYVIRNLSPMCVGVDGDVSHWFRLNKS